MCWTMIELKSIVKSEQSSVNILSQFWIELDNMSSQHFWILKFIYQNYTASTLYHYSWLPSSGISTWHSHKMAPFIGDRTMLIFHKQHNLTDWSLKELNVIVWCIKHLQLNTLVYWLSPLHNFIQLKLNSGSAQVQTLLAILDPGPGWK